MSRYDDPISPADATIENALAKVSNAKDLWRHSDDLTQLIGDAAVAQVEALAAVANRLDQVIALLVSQRDAGRTPD